MRSAAVKHYKKLTKKDIINFFDNMVKTKLKKLSVQEFSQKAKSIPTSTPSVRGYKSVLVKKFDFFRKRNKYLN
jgi:hypothetical protein